jgi:hypothetical protein
MRWRPQGRGRFGAVSTVHWLQGCSVGPASVALFHAACGRVQLGKAKAENVAPKKVVPKVTPASRVDPGTPSIRARKVTKADNGKNPVGPGLTAEVRKIEPIRETKVGPPTSAKPAGKTPTGVFAPKKQPALPQILEGKGLVAELINKAELGAQERKDWTEAGFDTCQTPKCGRPSVYVVEPADAGPEDDEDFSVFCIPCTRAKLGLKK